MMKLESNAKAIGVALSLWTTDFALPSLSAAERENLKQPEPPVALSPNQTQHNNGTIRLPRGVIWGAGAMFFVAFGAGTISRCWHEFRAGKDGV